MSMNSVDDLQLLGLLAIEDKTGTLIVAESGDMVPIEFKRVFMISGEAEGRRGRHAHRKLTQVLTCVNGVCLVVCDDGKSTREITLEKSGKALLIPPGIWAEQIYLVPATVLVVLCDFPYDEADYIRNYDDFLNFRKREKL